MTGSPGSPSMTVARSSLPMAKALSHAGAFSTASCGPAPRGLVPVAAAMSIGRELGGASAPGRGLETASAIRCRRHTRIGERPVYGPHILGGVTIGITGEDRRLCPNSVFDVAIAADDADQGRLESYS